MGTTMKQDALSKRKSQRSVPRPGERGSSRSRAGRPSPKNTKSTTRPRSPTKTRGCRTACPECGSPKVPHAATCWECYSKGKTSKSIELLCGCCGKKFQRPASEHQKSLDRVGKNARAFCGRDCYREYKRKNPVSYSKVKGACLNCSKPVTGYSRQKFCSRSCYAAYREARRSSEEYGGEFLALKASVYRRDKGCQLCGQVKSRKEAHHIDGDASNNDVRNLITLCPPCHRKYHRFTEQVRSILLNYFLTKTT